MSTRPMLALLSTLALLATTALAAPAARADTVTDQIDAARQLYGDGDLGGALTELGYAVQDIKAKQAALLATTLPDAPAGWSAEEPEVTSAGGAEGMGGLVAGQMIERQYTRDDGGATMTAELMADNPMIAMMAGLVGNPAFASSQTGMERVRIGRESAMLQWNGDGTGEINLLLGNRVLVKVSGEGLEDKEDLVALLKAWKLDELKAKMGV
ncbi:hypothetical protein [Marinivivus vitaminiproducens]|uniref:hypothetical protein n=1 Tax=Marinivivus vitaminiproducens TaxID=3035935 RepID=UPI0027A07FB3|nr:hypothetical protein P4R82_12895 [Geminicoccaceae bacterium SCSIO 64248]